MMKKGFGIFIVLSEAFLLLSPIILHWIGGVPFGQGSESGEMLCMLFAAIMIFCVIPSMFLLNAILIFIQLIKRSKTILRIIGGLLIALNFAYIVRLYISL